MRRVIPIIVVIISITLGIAYVQTTHGQADFCPALVTRALEQVGQNCSSLDRNSACYGFNRVNATFLTEQEETTFSQPADQVQIELLESLATAPLNVNDSEWGIAVMNVQANLPDMLPGQSVTMLLLGDVEIESATPTTPAAQIEPVSLTSLDWLNMRTNPSPRANVLTSIPPSTALLTDGTDRTGEWLRIAFENRLGWVSREWVVSESPLDNLLPVEQQSPGVMQAFFLRTGIMGVSCEEAPPSMLLIQSPQNLTVALSINGVEFSIGSTIGVQSSPETGQMNLGVFEGHAEFEDGTRVEQGNTVEFTLDENGSVSSGPMNLRPFTEEELRNFQGLQNLPGELLSYTFEVTAADDEATQVPDEAPVANDNTDTNSSATTAPSTPAATSTAASSTPTTTPTNTPTTTSTPTLPPVAPMGSVMSLTPLTVSAPCVPTIAAARPFIISNPNASAVGINWSVDGAVSGSETVGANSSVTLNVPNQGNNIITVSWTGGSTSADSNPCSAPILPTNTPTSTPVPTNTPTPTPLQAPQISTSCNDPATGNHIFTVTNPNATTMNANITSTAGSGTLTIGGGTSSAQTISALTYPSASLTAEWGGLSATSSCP
jgi:hypothetical protein